MRSPRLLLVASPGGLAEALTAEYECTVVGQLTSYGAALVTLEALNPDALVVQGGLPGELPQFRALVEAAMAGDRPRSVVALLSPGSGLLGEVHRLGTASVLVSPNGRLPYQVADSLGLVARRTPGCRSVALVSSRGGVGRTLLALNLASAFQREAPSSRALVWELDWGAPMLAHSLSLRTPPPLWRALAAEQGAAAASLEESLVERQGLSLLLAPELGTSAAPSAESLAAALQDLGQRFGWLILDVGSHLRSALTLSALHLADHLLLVGRPTSLGLHDLQRLVRLLASLELEERCSILLNRVTAAVDTNGLARAVGCPLAGSVPFDSSLEQAFESGSPLCAPTSRVARALDGVRQHLRSVIA